MNACPVRGGYKGAVKLLVVLTVAFGVALCGAGASAKPSPAPAPPMRSAINTCDPMWFYVWPNDDGIPVRAHTSPAHAGESFELLGEDRYALDAQGYYETTIIAVPGVGSGHLWISDRCLNPPPFKKH
ncbi:MAG: hypothetical protein JOY59_02880 [Candidatus Eremiobacteraeota bacterium]|nr:hypothetical protein [Candidatus Eremiobacteraeota bacterium]